MLADYVHWAHAPCDCRYDIEIYLILSYEHGAMIVDASVVTNIRIRIRIRIFSSESRIFGFGFVIFCKTNNIRIRIRNRILTSESESF